MTHPEERHAAQAALRHVGELYPCLSDAMEALSRFDAVMRGHIQHEDLEDMLSDEAAELRLRTDRCSDELEVIYDRVSSLESHLKLGALVDDSDEAYLALLGGGAS